VFAAKVVQKKVAERELAAASDLLLLLKVVRVLPLNLLFWSLLLRQRSRRSHVAMLATVSYPKVAVADVSGSLGRGLVAESKFESGQVLAAADYSSAITLKPGEPFPFGGRSPYNEGLQQHWLAYRQPFARLALKLLWEVGKLYCTCTFVSRWHTATT
jgi:hypothetical protein